jgi:hypothetical protein
MRPERRVGGQAQSGAARCRPCLLLWDWHERDKSVNSSANAQKILISQPRFFHFTLNQYKATNGMHTGKVS